MMISSFVGMTRTSIFERGVEMTVSSARVRLLASRSSSRPQKSRFAQIFSRSARVVLGDAGGEDEHVGAVQFDEELADVFADCADENIERDVRVGVAFRGCVEQVADVAGREAGHALEAGV